MRTKSSFFFFFSREARGNIGPHVGRYQYLSPLSLPPFGSLCVAGASLLGNSREGRRRSVWYGAYTSAPESLPGLMACAAESWTMGARDNDPVTHWLVCEEDSWQENRGVSDGVSSYDSGSEVLVGHRHQLAECNGISDEMDHGVQHKRRFRIVPTYLVKICWSYAFLSAFFPFPVLSLMAAGVEEEGVRSNVNRDGLLKPCSTHHFVGH